MKDFYLKMNPGKSNNQNFLYFLYICKQIYNRLPIFMFFFFQGETEQPFAVPLLAGMAARVFSVTVVSPLELIRTKMQSQKLSYYG